MVWRKNRLPERVKNAEVCLNYFRITKLPLLYTTDFYNNN